MSESVYFAGADAVMTLGGASLAGIKGWSFEIQWDHNDLYSMDSIFLLASAKFNQRIPIKMKYVKFDPLVTTWWVCNVLHPSTGFDGTIEDTSKVKEFTITGLVKPFTSAGGEANLLATISGVYFEGFPFAVDENEWVVLDLSAIGSDCVFSNPA